MIVDFDKIKEAQARQDERRDGACDVGCAEDDADRALLLAAVPWLLTENARLAVEIERRNIDIKRMRDLATVAREQLDADMTATASATLGAL